MLDSNEHYFCERYHIPRIPCGDHLLVCVLYYILLPRSRFTLSIPPDHHQITNTV
jgi:hypothetical protein